MCPPDVFILYLRCTETPCIARRAHRPVSEQHLQVSAPPHLAFAVTARRFRHTQQTPLHAAAPAIVLASDRPSLSPPPWFRNYGRSSRRQSHNVEVYTVGRPRTTPEAARLAQAA